MRSQTMPPISRVLTGRVPTSSEFGRPCRSAGCQQTIGKMRDSFEASSCG